MHDELEDEKLVLDADNKTMEMFLKLSENWGSGW